MLCYSSWIIHFILDSTDRLNGPSCSFDSYTEYTEQITHRYGGYVHGLDNRGTVLQFQARKRQYFPLLDSALFSCSYRKCYSWYWSEVRPVFFPVSTGLKWSERQADHSSPSKAEVNNAWSYTSAPTYVFAAWWLMRHRGERGNCMHLTLDCYRMLFIEFYHY
jgi:hypothetical protein